MDDDLEARNATRQAHLAERKAQERAARREALKALEGQQGVVIRWVCPAHDQPQVLYVAGRYTFEGAPAEVWHQIGKRPVFEDGVAAPDGHRNRRMDCPVQGCSTTARWRVDKIEQLVDQLYDLATIADGPRACRTVKMPV